VTEFQSSPDPKVGCYASGHARPPPPHCFNPHPTRRSGATLCRDRCCKCRRFQSSPDPKVGCYQGMMVRVHFVDVFQSSPDPKVGCYAPNPARSSLESRFNPHPTRRSGATPFFRGIIELLVVSILTRPEGRVLPVRAPGHSRLCRFQSSPDPKVGCYALRCGVAVLVLGSFQSSPDPKVGCYEGC